MDVNFPMEPPVNNLIQPTLYDRIGAITFEKIRVANTQLDTRLTIQEKIINKYRRDAEKVHQNQSRRVRREMRKIRKRKPNYMGESDLDLSVGKVDTLSSKDGGRQRSVSETSDCSFCRRYYSHHFNIKDGSKSEKEKQKKSDQNDFFNSRLRCFFMNVVNRSYDAPTPPSELASPSNTLSGDDVLHTMHTERPDYDDHNDETLQSSFSAITLGSKKESSDVGRESDPEKRTRPS